jgi:hypothetical protein
LKVTHQKINLIQALRDLKIILPGHTEYKQNYFVYILSAEPVHTDSTRSSLKPKKNTCFFVRHLNFRDVYSWGGKKIPKKQSTPHVYRTCSIESRGTGFWHTRSLPLTGQLCYRWRSRLVDPWRSARRTSTQLPRVQEARAH